MANSIAPKFSSGIGAVDGVWGGLFEGGSYLVHGSVPAGRTIVPLLFTQQGCDNGDRCLFISPDRPKDLIIQASAIGFDLKAAHSAGSLKLVRIPALLGYKEVDDDILAAALAELIGIIRKNRASRVVVNQFLPFAQFRSFNRFRTEVIKMFDELESSKSTMMIVMPEPETPVENKVVAFLRERTVASIMVGRSQRGDGSAEYFLNLEPQFGHLTKQARVDWSLAEALDKSEPLYTEDLDFFTSQIPSLSDRELDTLLEEMPDEVESEFDQPTVGEEWLAEQVASPEPPEVDSSPLGVETLPWESTTVEQRDVENDSESQSRSANDVLAQDYIFEDSLDLGSLEPEAPDDSNIDELFFDFEKREAGTYKEIKSNVYTSRDRFEPVLQRYFSDKTSDDIPFLLIAMRMDRRLEEGVLDFDFVSDVVVSTIGHEDALYVGQENERLVVVLANTEPGGAQEFFSRIRKELRNESPRLAETLLQTVSAIVVQGGHPFSNAAEFLSYVLDNH